MPAWVIKTEESSKSVILNQSDAFHWWNLTVGWVRREVSNIRASINNYYTSIINCKSILTKRTRSSAVFEVLVAVVMKSSVFWDVTPCNPLKVNRRSGGTSTACCRLLVGLLLGLLLNPEAAYSSGMSLNSQRITRCCIPEDIPFQEELCSYYNGPTIFWQNDRRYTRHRTLRITDLNHPYWTSSIKTMKTYPFSKDM
jgi:hypothetical protein